MSECTATTHDTADAYNNHACHCPEAVRLGRAQKNRAAQRRRWGHRTTVPIVGTRRRLQALCAIGWDTVRLADMASMPTLRGKAMYGDWPNVHVKTAAAVRELYDQLSMTPGPSTYARRTARIHGWPPPLAFDDDTIDLPDDEVDHLARKRAGFTRWTPFEQRFWGQVDKADTCWLWTGRLDCKGYGVKIGYLGRSIRPHRLAYELLVGPIPDGLVLDHLCRVRNCANPDHLEPVTAEENTRRGTDARWLEDCANGHPAPLYRVTLPSGKTICRECRRLSDIRRDQRDRESRRAAARARYAARQELVDPIVIDRLITGQPANATRAERVEAVRRMADAKKTSDRIAASVGVSERTVDRIRAQLRNPTASPSPAALEATA